MGLNRMALLVVAAIGCALLTAGCGASDTDDGRGKAIRQGVGGRTVAAAETAQAIPTTPPPPADSSGAGAAKTKSGPHDPKAGEAPYIQYCATCHGARGDGDGPAGRGLDPKPARHSDGQLMNALSNEHLFKIIKEGGPSVGKSPLMAPWGSALSDEQIWAVVAFTRSLAEPPYTGPKP